MYIRDILQICVQNCQDDFTSFMRAYYLKYQGDNKLILPWLKFFYSGYYLVNNNFIGIMIKFIVNDFAKDILKQ